MVNEEELWRKSLDLAEMFLSGKLSADDALNAWPPFSAKKHRDLFRLYEAIDHYRVDFDIREKEPEYARSQLDTIHEIYEELKARAQIKGPGDRNK